MNDPLNGSPGVEAVKVEPYQSFADLKDAHTELLKLDSQITDRSAFLDRVEDFCNRAHVTGALLGRHDDRRATQSMLNYWVATLFSSDRSPEQTILQDFDASQIAKIKDEDCPYPGSRPFRETDAKNFYGRRTATEYISNRLKVDRLLVLTGPSGRGKTSLLLAGILPSLRFDDECAARKRFYFPLLVPGSDPLGSLERMIKSSTSESTQPIQTPFKNFERNPKFLLESIKQVTDLPAVILVDQLEDIFNLSPDRKVQRAFIANLLNVVQDPGTNHTVILTLRDDSYDDEIKRLPKLFQDQLEPAKWTAPPLGAAEIGDAIKKPAEKVGLIIDDQTLLSLIKEILAEPIGLPLLQFALHKLWAGRNERNEVPDRVFADMGGCRAAFVNTADQLYKELKPNEKETMRSLLMRMVNVDDQTVVDVPVRRSDLYKTAKKESVDLVLQRLSEEGLVRFSENPQPDDLQVEMTHISLVRAWTEMANLVAAKKSTQRFLKYAVIVFIFLGGALLIMWGTVQFIRWRHDENQLLSLRIAQQSDRLLGQHRYDLAMLVGLHAFRINDNPTSRSHLLNVLRLSPQPYRFLSKPDYGAADLAFSLDKKNLATLDVHGNISIWDLDTDRTVERVLTSSNKAGFPLMFSADGKTLASAASVRSFDGTAPDPQSNIRLWDVSSAETKDLFVDKDYQVTTMAFAPNGGMLFAGGSDGKVFRWDLTKEKPEPGLVTILQGPVKAISVNSAGTMMACGGSDGNTGLWSLEKWQKLKTVGTAAKPKQQQQPPSENDAVWSLAFSPDNKMLVVDSTTSTAVWDAVTGQELQRFSNEEENAGFISSFSQDGRTLTSYSGDGKVFFWDIANGGRSQLRTPLYQSLFLALAADGTLLALPDEDGITIWNLGENRPLKIPEGLPNIDALAFDPAPQSTTLAVALNEGQILLWDTASRQEVGKLEPKIKTGATRLAFSPDGRTLAEGLFDGTILLWNVAGRSQIAEIKTGSGNLLDLVYSPDGKRLATVIYPGPKQPYQLILRDLESWTERKVENLGDVTSVAISNDGKTLFAGNVDGKVFALDITTQETIAEFPAEQSAITSVRLDASGTRLATGTKRALKVRDVSDLSQIKEVFHKPRLGVFQLAFSPGGEVLGILTPSKSKTTMWGRARGGLILLDVKTGDQLGNPITNETDLVGFALRSDGRMLASAEDSSAIDLWDLELRSIQNFCAIANANPSLEDWKIFVGRDQKYCKICSQFDSGAGAPADASPCDYWKWWKGLAKYIV